MGPSFPSPTARGQRAHATTRHLTTNTDINVHRYKASLGNSVDPESTGMDDTHERRPCTKPTLGPPHNRIIRHIKGGRMDYISTASCRRNHRIFSSFEGGGEWTTNRKNSSRKYKYFCEILPTCHYCCTLRKYRDERRSQQKRRSPTKTVKLTANF